MLKKGLGVPKRLLELAERSLGTNAVVGPEGCPLDPSCHSPVSSHLPIWSLFNYRSGRFVLPDYGLFYFQVWDPDTVAR